jgi:hypothetical protein
MKTVLGILIGLFISLQLNAQDLEYGKVDVVDFTLEAQDVKETPDAVIILKKEHVEFSISQNNGITQKRTVHERIKINTEAGLEYATKKILLYMEDGSIAEKFSNLEAATYNLVDGKVRRKKLKKSGVFEKDINDLYRVKSFTMPEAKIGSVIEFTYKIGSPYVAIDDFIVQYDIPILNIDVRMEWLESLNTNFIITQGLNTFQKSNMTPVKLDSQWPLHSVMDKSKQKLSLVTTFMSVILL